MLFTHRASKRFTWEFIFSSVLIITTKKDIILFALNDLQIMNFFQHLNKASLDYCAQVGIWTPEKKQKFKIHNGSVSEIVLFTVHFQDKADKKCLQSMPCWGIKVNGKDVVC